VLDVIGMVAHVYEKIELRHQLYQYVIVYYLHEAVGGIMNIMMPWELLPGISLSPHQPLPFSCRRYTPVCSKSARIINTAVSCEVIIPIVLVECVIANGMRNF
jgi:hypothetical protein